MKVDRMTEKRERDWENYGGKDEFIEYLSSAIVKIHAVYCAISKLSSNVRRFKIRTGDKESEMTSKEAGNWIDRLSKNYIKGNGSIEDIKTDLSGLSEDQLKAISEQFIEKFKNVYESVLDLSL